MKRKKLSWYCGLYIILGCLIVCINVFIVATANANSTTDWESDVVRATGFGAAPTDAKTLGHARNLAHQAAILDAYRNLAEQVNGVYVTAESTVENSVLANDSVRTKVKSVIRRAKVVTGSERYDKQGNCTLTVELPLYGSTNSIANAVLPATPVQISPVPNANIVAEGNYTGLVVDCSGLGLNPSMMPVIQSENGTIIYCYEQINYDVVVSKGMVGFSKSTQSDFRRAEAHPLIIKAVGLTHNNGNPIISNEDANRVLTENSVSHFLQDCKVVFVL